MECDLNHFHGTGTIINDATLKELPNQKCVASFKLRISEIVTTRAGAKIPKTNVLTILAWNALAEHTTMHGKAGEHVCVHGRVHVADLEGRNGEKNSIFEIHLTTKLTTVEEWMESLPSPPPLTPRYPEMKGSAK